MPTIRDLVKLCPGCGRSVVWPFTQSFDPAEIALTKQGKTEEGTPASPEEKDILSKQGLTTRAREIGVRIPTIRIGPIVGGVLWHEPCLILHRAFVHDETEKLLNTSVRKSVMRQLINLLVKSINKGKFKLIEKR